MKILHLVTVALITLGSNPLWAACSKPEAPAIPDGAKAEKSEFLAGYQQVKEYLNEADGYLKCLEGEEKAELKADKSTEETRAARLNLYNETVDEMQKTGADLNAEVGKFKARTDP